MPESPKTEPDPLALALGRIPSGLFILTARRDGRATGMLASWVQQAGFSPPMLTVAVKADRFLRDWLRDGSPFALNQLAAGQKGLLRHFAKGFAPDEDAFSGLSVADDAFGQPLLADALGALSCEVAGEFEAGDHVVFVARIRAGAVHQPAGDPMVHIRRSGLHY